MYLFIGTVHVNEHLKDIYLNCRERYEDMIDRRCYTHNSFRPERFLGFNFTNASVVWITALINYFFIGTVCCFKMNTISKGMY